MAKKEEEDMLTIPGHKRNVNQNLIKIPFHYCYNGYHQKHKQQQMFARIWGERNSITLLMGM
jgi:hypothetical protein